VKNRWGLFVAVSSLLIAVVLNGCSGNAKPRTGDTVKVEYTLTVDGVVFDTSEGEEPLEFEIGAEQMIPGFEKAVKGMKVGETKQVTLKPEDAYGERNENLTAVIDRSELPAEIVPEVGLHLQAQSDDGSIRVVTITAVTDTTIAIDGNHPLAGKTLTFEIKLVEIVRGK